MSEETVVQDQPCQLQINDDPTNLKILCMEMLKVLNASAKKSRHRSIAITKLEEVVHRLDDVMKYDD